MNELIISNVLASMSDCLDCDQLKRLKSVLAIELAHNETDDNKVGDDDLLSSFLEAKELEGCSQRTIAYYKATLQKLNENIDVPWCQVTTNDLRRYFSKYQDAHSASNVTMDNIRRIFSSFFGWLEDEDYIVKSPVRRIHHVKTPKIVKEIITDEQIETLRDECACKRDLAIIDLLASTGMRVGELVRLNRDDIDFNERECLVMGKGNKQRKVYFDARAKLHLQHYLNERDDNCPALFVASSGRAHRLTIGAIESRLRCLGRRACKCRIYPHKFRRTLATNAIDKGMPIEQVQKLLGHARIDTTMQYALVNQNNVKASHRRYLG